MDCGNCNNLIFDVIIFSSGLVVLCCVGPLFHLHHTHQWFDQHLSAVVTTLENQHVGSCSFFSSSSVESVGQLAVETLHVEKIPDEMLEDSHYSIIICWLALVSVSPLTVKSQHKHIL